MWLTGTVPFFLYHSFAAASRIGNDAFELRLARHDAAENRGIEFAVEQHFGDVLAGGGALDAGRIAIFGHMRVLERHPLHLAEIETVVLPQNAAYPDARGLRERAHADPSAGKIFAAAAFRARNCTAWCRAGSGPSWSPA